ncbi:phosphoglycerate kinase [Patescibacteria group bacterium]|nr:phosphoglycerate kinase [Patescibacteria group bacterium]
MANLKSVVEDRVGNLVVLDSIRFFKEEKENDKNFIAILASLADVYVNEAFGVAHREQASITGVPRVMPSFAGLRLEAEVRTLSHIKDKAAYPLVCVLGGSKLGKLDYIEFLSSWADKLLVGGKLPTLIKEKKFEINKDKVVLAELTENGRDISTQSIENFKQEIKNAGSIFWAGPMGVYEEEENRRGTTEVVEFMSKMDLFKVAGGGDTHRVLSWLNCWDCFDFVSVGGGAALQFLKDKSLPGLEALNLS